MTPADRLIEAWMHWEANPRWAEPTNHKIDLLLELGMPLIATHDLIADMRRAGYSIPDSCQVAINDLMPGREAAA